MRRQGQQGRVPEGGRPPPPPGRVRLAVPKLGSTTPDGRVGAARSGWRAATGGKEPGAVPAPGRSPPSPAPRCRWAHPQHPPRLLQSCFDGSTVLWRGNLQDFNKKIKIQQETRLGQNFLDDCSTFKTPLLKLAILAPGFCAFESF